MKPFIDKHKSMGQLKSVKLFRHTKMSQTDVRHDFRDGYLRLFYKNRNFALDVIRIWRKTSMRSSSLPFALAGSGKLICSCFPLPNQI